MPKLLSTQQVKQFHDDGYLSPIDIMSEEEAQHYREQLEAAESDYPQIIHGKNRNNAHLAFKFLDELAFHPHILDVVEDLIGPDFSLWETVLFTKEPNSPGFVSWHQDATYMGMNRNDFVTPWIALTHSNRETGCLTMIPGSHHQHIVPHEDTFGEHNILTRGQQIPDVDISKGVDLILRPGQMSIHHGEVVHGSQPNRSQQRRIGFALQSFMNHQTRQTIGRNEWLHARGKPREDEETVFFHRPRYDLDPVSLADREAANHNMAEILYHGASQRREY